MQPPILLYPKTLNSHGPAEKSGVKPNDVIIRINGIETHSLRKRTIGSLIERFHVHVTIECIEDKDLENFSHSKIDSYPQDPVILPETMWTVIEVGQVNLDDLREHPPLSKFVHFLTERILSPDRSLEEPSTLDLTR